VKERIGLANFQGIATKIESLKSIFSGFCIIKAFEEHESVTASGIRCDAIENAVLNE